MVEVVIQGPGRLASTAQPGRIALLGNPNCGKTALFNLLTGSRQKVANYAGVTVERKEGTLRTPSGRRVFVLDLPGAYSLNALSADEAVTRDIVTGQSKEALPDLLVCVTDATNLRLNLRLVIEAKRLGLPMVVALNMTDMAKKQGIVVDTAVLSRELGVPVIETVGVHTGGAQGLLAALDTPVAAATPQPWQAPGLDDVLATQREVRRILGLTVKEPVGSLATSDRIDRVVLHPVWGMLVLAVTMFLMFQAVFSWANVPMDAIKAGTEGLGNLLKTAMPEGMLQSLLVDGVIAGVGGVIVFLPQILILFLFILALEDSGYLPRAAFLLDRVMGTVGLSGRSFIPLLSSFACAIPGVMATRTISNWRDRITTIMIAPLMTCSARLPVYALLIAAFIPARTVGGVFNLQGVVLFALYVFGIVSAMAVAWVMKRFRDNTQHSPLLMELPAYRWPKPAQPGDGPVRARMDLHPARGRDHPDADDPAVVPVDLPVAARRRDRPGHPVQPGRHDRPWAGVHLRAHRLQLADLDRAGARHGGARSGRGCARHGVRAVGHGRRRGGPAGAAHRGSWSLATALSLLVWYVFAPQCISTLAAVKRETGSWKYVWIMAGYLFALAYMACFITYRVAVALGAG